MCPMNLSVWFACKSCKSYFSKVADFIDHKKKSHFNEFRRTMCIVFEERLEHSDEYNSLESPVLASEEARARAVQIDFENTDSTSFNDENDDEMMGETSVSSYEINREQSDQNPFVRLERLTAKEIQNSSEKQDQTNFSSTSDYILGLDSIEEQENENSFSSFVEQTEFKPGLPIISTENSDQFTCKLCSTEFPSESELKTHIELCALTHEHRDRYCVTCNKLLNRRFALQEHFVRLHASEEEKSALYKFKCPQCPKKYQRRIAMLRHMESHKSREDRLAYKCHLCESKIYVARESLILHLKKHGEFEPFKCPELNCDISFVHTHPFSLLTTLGTQERLYKCTVENCTKAFSQARYLTDHKRREHHRTE